MYNQSCNSPVPPPVPPVGDLRRMDDDLEVDVTGSVTVTVAASIPRPTLRLSTDGDEDDWGLSKLSCGSNRRKRRISEDSPLRAPEQKSSPKAICLVRRQASGSPRPRDEIGGRINPGGMDLLETLFTGSDGGELQALVASVMSEGQLRSLASLSTEWRQVAYETIRRQKGDQMLIFLWAVGGWSPEICLQEHFHSSFIKPPRPDRQEEPTGGVAQSGTECCVKFGKSYLVKRPREIETIVSFGNESMTKQMEVLDNEDEMPRVKHYFHVCSEIILFSTPDMKKIGDSVKGVYGPTTPISSSCTGHFLASFAFPRSAAFELRSVTLTMRKGKYETSTGGLGDHNEEGLVTKALIFFKIYDDSRVEDWMKNITESAANHADKAVRVISGTFESVGSSLVRFGHSLHAAGLALIGNSAVSTFCVEFYMESFNQYSLSLKMNEMFQFVEREKVLSSQRGEGTDGYFAWMFWFSERPVRSTLSVCYPSTVVGIFNTFHRGFPTIPIQGIQSIGYLNCVEVGRNQEDASSGIDIEIDDDLSDKMNRLVANSNSCKKDKVVILLVKYSIV